MESVSSTDATQKVQEVASVDNTQSTDSQSDQSAGSSDFEVMLKSLISPGPGNMVSEEELFAGVVHERIKTLKGDEAAAKYDELLAQSIAGNTRADGRYSHEKCAVQALNQLKESGLLTEEESQKVYAEAFDAAQLDDNKSALYDAYGSENDPTIAVALMESALSAAKLMVEKMASGEATAELRELEESTGGGAGAVSSGDLSTLDSGSVESQALDGSEGFLFKPVSDSDGKLAILMPADLAGDVVEVLLKDPEGKKIEEGRYGGNGNGGRDHYRFNRAGGDYPENLVVEAVLKNGSSKTWDIPSPSQRYD